MEQRRKYKIQPPSIWELVRRDYLAGDGARQVAARYGVGTEALRARASREGWSRYLQPQTEPKGEAATDKGSWFDGLPDEGAETPDDPAVLARTATVASGRAMRARAWTEARTLAGLAEAYHKLAERADPARNGLTAETAPLELVLDILTMDRIALEDRFWRKPDEVDPVKAAYHEWRRQGSLRRRAHEEVKTRRRSATEARVEALEAQLAGRGIPPVEEDERAARVRLGIDVIAPDGAGTRQMPAAEFRVRLED
ncbi:hypothetical protein [Brevundimonas mediterranea]|uniref:Uncharacterized protein n=1 Tax=Brevundimonas mediterranea TaxID=74329 RepID=A0A7W6A799_9CAUL|nr:hypothetical protein [Brevundimonas mediterranea]MBB3873452.1 hypothetical protein [Brevundimonas mediterranea]